MPASVYGGGVPNVFHNILGGIFHNEIDKSDQTWMSYLERKPTKKRWFDQVEIVDPGLWDVTDEGSDIDLDEFSEGMIRRMRPRKFAKRLVIPEEIFEDGEYEEAYDATRMLARTYVQTLNYSAADIIDDAFNADITGADGLELCSTLHVIKGGATLSNELDPPLSPSNTAVQTMLVQAKKMKGTNGFVASIKIVKIFGAADHEWRFNEILHSEKRDDTSNNAINVLKGQMSREYGAVPEQASATTWFAHTNAPRGAQMVERRAARYRQSNSDTNETKIFTGSARWVVDWLNWRTYIGSAI